MSDLKAPFPWFGGKRRVAPLVWARVGADVSNYVEPFAGSLAVLLGRPAGAAGVETVNDADGLVANFWRAVSFDAAEVWRWADAPVNEADLHARHVWLLDRLADGFVERVMGDPDFVDYQVAGWWVWGLCSWIGTGWCSGNGSWVSVDGKLVSDTTKRGINRQLPHLGNAGQGINRQLPHLSDAGPLGELASRLRHVRVACGDWTRILGPSVTTNFGVTAVMLDPPYAVEDRSSMYRLESFTIADSVREWCHTNGRDPKLRIALCGYDTEHGELENDGWTVVEWSTPGGYGSSGKGETQGAANRTRERIWFSPHCLAPDQQSLF